MVKRASLISMKFISRGLSVFLIVCLGGSTLSASIACVGTNWKTVHESDEVSAQIPILPERRSAPTQRRSASSRASMKISVNAPNQVLVGEYFIVEYLVNASADAILEIQSDPVAKGLKKVYQTQHPSMNVTTVNGQASYQLTIKYLYTYVAESAGRYTVEGFSLVDDSGNVISSSPKTISVEEQGATKVESSKHFYVYRIELEHTSGYEQEPIIATAKLYSTSRSISLQYGYQSPTFSSFITVPAPSDQVNNTFAPATFKGKTCYSVELGKMILYPTRAGKLSIESDQIDISVYVPNQRNPFLSEQKDVLLTSPQVQLQVKPLPQEGRPDDYSDAVGRFSLRSELGKEGFATNKAFTYKVYIEGRGDLRTSTIQMGKEETGSDLEFYPPNVQQEQNISGGTLQTSKVYEYTIIPRKAGRCTLPGFSFVYFDTSTATYRKLEIKPITIDVEMGDETSEALLIYGNGDQSKEWTLTSLKGATSYVGYSFVRSWLYWGLNLLMVVLGYMVYWLFRRRLQSMADTQSYKAKHAGNKVHRRLAQANKLLEQGELQAFYEEAQRALWSYIQDKFACSAERLNRSDLRLLLQDIGASEQDLRLWLETMDALEFARFASGMSSSSPHALYEKAAEAIARVEQLTKKG